MPEQTTSPTAKGAASDKAATAEKAASAAVTTPEPEPTPEPQRYDTEYLLEHSRAFFGERRAVIAGALASNTDGRRTQFTKEEVVDLLKANREREVETWPRPDEAADEGADQ